MLPAISGIRCELESIYSDVTALEISVFSIQSTAAETAAFPQENILRVSEGAGRAAVRSAALRCGGRSDSRCRSAERRAMRPLCPLWAGRHSAAPHRTERTGRCMQGTGADFCPSVGFVCDSRWTRNVCAQTSLILHMEVKLVLNVPQPGQLRKDAMYAALLTSLHGKFSFTFFEIASLMSFRISL